MECNFNSSIAEVYCLLTQVVVSGEFKKHEGITQERSSLNAKSVAKASQSQVSNLKDTGCREIKGAQSASQDQVTSRKIREPHRREAIFVHKVWQRVLRVR